MVMFSLGFNKSQLFNMITLIIEMLDVEYYIHCAKCV